MKTIRIEVPDDVAKALKFDAVSAESDLKNYVQDLLTRIARESKYWQPETNYTTGFSEDGLRYFCKSYDNVGKFQLSKPYDIETRMYRGQLSINDAIDVWKRDKDIITKL